jgi:hypothetical protein
MEEDCLIFFYKKTNKTQSGGGLFETTYYLLKQWCFKCDSDTMGRRKERPAVAKKGKDEEDNPENEL